MAERVCVFVDGENFRHSIEGLFSPHFNRRDYLPKKADWAGFFDWLVSSAVGVDAARLRTYWYVVDCIDFMPYRFPRDADSRRRLLSRSPDFKAQLSGLAGTDLSDRCDAIEAELTERRRRMESRFGGWTVMQNGIAKSHRAIEFRRAGSIKYDLFDGSLGQEKAVDVKLATDLIILQDIYDIAVIVSGDQDYVPAVERIKDCGKLVVNIAFKKRDGKLLPGGAWRLNNITDWSMDVPHGDFEGFLRI